MTDSREYNIWRKMKARYYDSKHVKFNLYGGRGITIHQDWLDSFTKFHEYMGDSPSDNHSIDRIDSDGNYEPGNVRWATDVVQNNNTSRNVKVTYKDNVLTLAEFAKEVNLPYYFVVYHHYQNKSPEDIANLEQNGRNEVQVVREYPNGDVELYASIRQASKLTGVSHTTIRRQIDQMYYGQCWRVLGDKLGRVQDGQKKFIVHDNEWLSLSEFARVNNLTFDIVQRFYKKGFTDGAEVLTAIKENKGKKNSGNRSKVFRKVNGEDIDIPQIKFG